MNLVLLSKDKKLVLSFWFSGLFILYVTALGRGSCTDCSPFLILPCLVNYLNIKDHRKSRQTFHATLSTRGIIFWSRNKCRKSFFSPGHPDLTSLPLRDGPAVPKGSQLSFWPSLPCSVTPSHPPSF